MTLTPEITLTRALTDPDLFGGTFAGPSFWTWRTVAKLIDGIALTEQREVELFERCTGLTYNRSNRRRLRRLILLAGRRAGKDRFFSAVAVWRAALCADWRQYQSAGEGAVCILLGADRRQARILRNYCEGLLRAPLLAPEVVRNTDELVEFRNGASLEISTNDARLVRGRSAIAVLGSECCHWRTDEHAASSDEEVVGAAEPSMAMCPDGGLLMLGSSVYRKRGYMHRQYRELHGNADAPDDTLCWFAPSAMMNPRLPQHVVDRALAENSAKARAEFLNIWREDLSDFIPLDAIEACSDIDVFERPPDPKVKYRGYVDCAGGTGSDSFAFAITHRESTYMLDVVREYKPRFVPAQVIAELAQLCRTYNITEIEGDKYAVGFHEAEWQAHGIRFVACERTTSENYLSLLPLVLARRVRLVDNKTLRSQLASLERRVGAADREAVTHPQHASAHDDIACAVAGALVLASKEMTWLEKWGPSLRDDDPPPKPAWQLAGFASEEEAWEYKRRGWKEYGRSIRFNF
jgi:hypothetical protein